jgi:hypothetical protein
MAGTPESALLLQRLFAHTTGVVASSAVFCRARHRSKPSNKGMKLTKPSVLELRSLSPVFGGPNRRVRWWG